VNTIPRPETHELDAFRNKVRRVIETYAPPLVAREGHRSPVNPVEEALLRQWFRRLFEVLSVRPGRRNMAVGATTIRCRIASSAKRFF
jgi:hypothetical protein